ncbi:MAG: hypothetical protein ACLFO5_02425 [Opitutales bacterium]
MMANKETAAANRPSKKARRRAWPGIALLVLMSLPLLYLLACGEEFFKRNLETDPTRLLPSGGRERAGVDAQIFMARKMARLALVYFPENSNTPAVEQKREFMKQAARSELFRDVIDLGDNEWMESLLIDLREFRLPLLFPLWLEAQREAWDGEGAFGDFAAQQAARKLDAWLDRGSSFIWDEWLPSDPLLLLPGALEEASIMSDFRRKDKSASNLVWLWLDSDVFSSGYRSDVEAFFEAQGEAFDFLVTGAFRFAGAGERQVRGELTLLAGVTTVALLLLVFYFLRRPGKLIPVVLNLTFSFSAALALAGFIFDRIHLVSFIFSLLFGGLAVDYTLHVLLKKESLRLPSYRRTLRAIARPLLGIGLTTALGFLVLVWQGVPVLRQMGVLVSCGIAFSLCFNLVYFPTVDALRPAARAEAATGRLDWMFPYALARILSIALLLLAAAGLLLVPGIRVQDDIADLRSPLPELMDKDRRVRAAAGAEGMEHAYLAVAPKRDANIRSLRALTAGENTEASSLGHLAGVFPTREEYEQARRFLKKYPDWEERLGRALEATDFEPDAFAPFWEAFAEYRERIHNMDMKEIAGELEATLRGPARFLLSRQGDRFVFGALGASSLDPDRLPPHIQALDYGGAISSVINEYRKHATGAFALAALILALVPLFFYSPRYGWRITALATIAVAGALPILVAVFGTLTLFHLAGLLVGACLAMDYAFFAVGSAHAESPGSIRLAAFSTFTVAAILGCSTIPAVAATSLSIASTVALGYLGAECYVARQNRMAKHSSATPEASMN